MSRSFKLKYKSSAFPFKTGIPEDDIKSKLYTHMTTPSKEMQQQQYSSSKSTSKGSSLIPIIVGQATITKKGSHGGGFVGLHKPTSFGSFTGGISGGGSTSKKYDYPGEGYKITPTLGVSLNIPSWKPFGKKKKRQ